MGMRGWGGGDGEVVCVVEPVLDLVCLVVRTLPSL